MNTKQEHKSMDTKLLALLKTVAMRKPIWPILAYARVASNRITVTDQDITVIIDYPESIADGVYSLTPWVRTTQAVQDFPEVPSFLSSEDKRTINISDLASAITHSSKDETRFNLCGVAVTSENALIATDGHRLYCSDLFAKDKNPLIIPTKACKTLIAYAKYKRQSHVELTHKDMRLSNAEISIRCIDGQYPDWRIVVPTGTRTIGHFDRKKAIEALKRAILLRKDDRYRPVKLETLDNKMLLRVSLHDIAEEVIELGIGKSEFLSCFNATYLLDAIKCSKNKTIPIVGTTAYNPVLIDNRSIVMPMKLDS